MKRFEEHAKHSGSDITYDTVVKQRKGLKSPLHGKKSIPAIFLSMLLGMPIAIWMYPGKIDFSVQVFHIVLRVMEISFDEEM
jgi:hypothetical protein